MPGHKKQILADLQDILLRDFLSEQKDISAQEFQHREDFLRLRKLIIRISGNMIREQTHGRRKQIFQELQEARELVFRLEILLYRDSTGGWVGRRLITRTIPHPELVGVGAGWDQDARAVLSIPENAVRECSLQRAREQGSDQGLCAVIDLDGYESGL